MEKNILETGYIKGKRETSQENVEAFIGEVEKKYKADGLDEKTLKYFMVHNRQVLDLVREIAKEEKLDEEELEVAELGAVLHDIDKIKDFENHGKNGGALAKEIVIRYGKSPKLAESVQRAINSHMCNTGYVGRKARERFGESFRYEEPKTKAEQSLYDADMLTILTVEGVKKLLRLRQITPKDFKEDKRTSKEKNISIEDAALLTIAESIKNTLESIKLNASKKIAQRLVEKILKEYPRLEVS